MHTCNNDSTVLLSFSCSSAITTDTTSVSIPMSDLAPYPGRVGLEESFVCNHTADLDWHLIYEHQSMCVCGSALSSRVNWIEAYCLSCDIGVVCSSIMDMARDRLPQEYNGLLIFWATTPNLKRRSIKIEAADR